MPDESQRAEWLNLMIWETPVRSWLILLAVALGIWTVLGLLLAFLRATNRKRLGEAADHSLSGAVLRRTTPLGLIGAGVLFALAVTPDLGAQLHDILMKAGLIAFTLQGGIYAMGMLDGAIVRVLRAVSGSDQSAQTAVGVVRFFATILVWVIVFLLILSNLGYQIAPLLAGLGIGGIAIAFALQKILGDIFCSVAIVLDRPFEVGDFIIVGTERGTVEKIGIKTTRIRSLGGEQIVVANADLLAARIQNFKRMNERRVVLRFGVLYSTTADKLEAIPDMVKQIVEATPRTRFDRAHFATFGASSLDFEVVYFMLDSDYNVFMNTQQAINLALVRRFAAEGIGFAFPTQTVHVESLPVLRRDRET